MLLSCIVYYIATVAITNDVVDITLQSNIGGAQPPFQNMGVLQPIQPPLPMPMIL